MTWEILFLLPTLYMYIFSGLTHVGVTKSHHLITAICNQENYKKTSIMAEQAAAVPDQNAPEELSTMQKVMSFASRCLTFWMIMNMFTGKKNTPTSTSAPAATVGSASSSGSVSSAPSMHALPSFRNGDHYNLFVYVTNFEKYDVQDDKFFEAKISNKVFGDWEEAQPEPISQTIKFPVSVRESNQTLYIHAFFTEPHIKEPSAVYRKSNKRCGYRSHLLTPFKKLIRHKRTANLITGKSDRKEEEILEDPKSAPIVAHFHRNLTLNVLYDVTPFNPAQLVPPFDTFLKFTDDYRNYEPTFFFNDYWNLQRDYQSLNETVKEMEFELTIFGVGLGPCYSSLYSFLLIFLRFLRR